MYQEILQEMGLTVNEAKVYENLLKSGITGANRISNDTRVQRRNVYDILKSLISKGLCSEFVEKGVKKFKAIHPERLKDILREKESVLEEVLPSMVQNFNESTSVEQTVVYKGIESVKNLYWDMIREGEDFFCIGGRGNWLDPRWKYFLPKFDKERLKKGIKYKHLFYQELKDTNDRNHKIIEILKDNQYRFLPKGFTSTCSIEIFSDRVASMYWGEEPFVVVIISKKIAEGYKKYFEFMWERSEKGNA